MKSITIEPSEREGSSHRQVTFLYRNAANEAVGGLVHKRVFSQAKAIRKKTIPAAEGKGRLKTDLAEKDKRIGNIFSTTSSFNFNK